jgi:hypothetical protein
MGYYDQLLLDALFDLLFVLLSLFYSFPTSGAVELMATAKANGVKGNFQPIVRPASLQLRSLATFNKSVYMEIRDHLCSRMDFDSQDGSKPRNGMQFLDKISGKSDFITGNNHYFGHSSNAISVMGENLGAQFTHRSCHKPTKRHHSYPISTSQHFTDSNHIETVQQLSQPLQVASGTNNNKQTESSQSLMLRHDELVAVTAPYMRQYILPNYRSRYRHQSAKDDRQLNSWLRLMSLYDELLTRTPGNESQTAKYHLQRSHSQPFDSQIINTIDDIIEDS